MKKLLICVLAICLVGTLAFSAGGRESVQAPQPTVTESALKGEIVISILDNNRPDMRNAITEVAAAYNRINPGVKIIFEPAVGGDYTIWLGTQLASGNIRPDIVSGNYQPSYSRYVNFDKYRYTTNPYTGNSWNDDLDFDFFAFRNPRSERVMVATQSVHTLWFYNKTIFDSLGLVPPTNWDELIAVCEVLDAAGQTPISSNYTYMIPQWIIQTYWDQFNRDWHNIVRAQPGDYNYDDELDGSFVYDPLDPRLGSNYNYNTVRFYRGIRDEIIRWDTPEFVDMITQFTKVFNRYVNDDVYVQADPYPRFLQGNSAMMTHGAWMIPTLRLDMANLENLDRRKALNIGENVRLQGFEWGTFKNPSMEGPNVMGTARSVESAFGEYISIIDKNQAQTDLVLDFVKFWLSSPGYQAFVDGASAAGTNWFPRGPIMIKDVALPGALDGLYDDVEMLGNAERPINNFVAHPGHPRYFQQSLDMFKLVLDGRITPEEYAKRRHAFIVDNFDGILDVAGLTHENLDNPARSPTN